MNIIIHYQTKRSPCDNCIYYPEDNRTPRERVDYVKSMKDKIYNDIIVVSCCPYIIEGFVKVFNNTDTKFMFYLNGVESTSEDIFKELADPMKELMFM